MKKALLVWLLLILVTALQTASAQISPFPGGVSLPNRPCPPGIDCNKPPPGPVEACKQLGLPDSTCRPGSKIEDVLRQAPPKVLADVFVQCLTTKTCPINLFDLASKRLSSNISEALQKQLRERALQWEGHVRYCAGSHREKLEADPRFKSDDQYRAKVERLPTAVPFPGKDTDGGQPGDDPSRPVACDDGDMTLFNGLLCYAGDDRGCKAVKLSQATDGSWWRSPKIFGVDRTVDHGEGKAATMSEEQTWGVFLYLLKTGDLPAFNRWTDWIAKKRECKLGNDSACIVRDLPMWCSDPNKTFECNFLPYECMLFEYLANRFDSNPLAAVSVSQKIGCDHVMGAFYGAAGGAIGILTAVLKDGFVKVLHEVPAYLLTKEGNRKALEDLAKKPPSLGSLPLSTFSMDKPPGDLQDRLKTAPMPLGPQKLCAKDVAGAFGLPLPPLMPADACVPTPLAFLPLRGPLPLPGRPPLGFTTNYPVGKQLLGEALVTDPGFALHKVAVKVFILEEIGLADFDTKRAAEVIRANSGNNPFFSYIAEQKKEAADLVLEKCPATARIQPASRHQWAWERDQINQAWLSSSYWDCLFAAKLLANIDSKPTPIMAAMQVSQNEAIRSPFTEKCDNFKSIISAGAQSAPAKETRDFLIRFPNPPRTDFKSIHWYRQQTFIAPCSGWYNISIQLEEPQGNKGIKLVRTTRYAEPIPVTTALQFNQFQAKKFYMEQYEGLAAVLPEGGARSIGDLTVWITWNGSARSGTASATDLVDRDPAKLASLSVGMFLWKGPEPNHFYHCPALVIATDLVLTHSKKSCRPGTEPRLFLNAGDVRLDVEPAPLEESEKFDFAIYKLRNSIPEPSVIAVLDKDAPGFGQPLADYGLVYTANPNNIRINFDCKTADQKDQNSPIGFVAICSSTDQAYLSLIAPAAGKSFNGLTSIYRPGGPREIVSTKTLRENSELLKTRAKWN